MLTPDIMSYIENCIPSQFRCLLMFINALVCCDLLAVLLWDTHSSPLSLSCTHTHLCPLPLPPCFTLHHHGLFSSVWSTVIASHHPHPTWLSFICHFFFLLRCFSPFLLSVSIGGHGLGKPNERLFVLLYCFLFIFCEHGGWWHRRSSGSPIMSLLFVLMTLFYPILFYFTYHNGFLLTFY